MKPEHLDHAGKRKGDPSAHYLIEAAYTAEAWKALLKKPADRRKVRIPAARQIRPLVDFRGARMFRGE
jgi:hypothetical protein